jgi:hypothetical protein
MRRKAILIFFLGTFLLSAAALSPREEGFPEIVSVLKSRGIEERLAGLGLDLLMERENKIYIVAGPSDLGLLDSNKISYAVETFSFPARMRGDVSSQGGINGAYHSCRELETDLRALERSYPGLAKVFVLGESLEKRKIYALKVSDAVGLDEDEAEVVFIGCHHAREWISVEVPFLLGKYLLEAYQSDPWVRSLVDKSEIWIVPIANPDGLEYSIQVYRYWRKNRRANADGSYGVDLNRNYGFMWGYDNLGSTSSPGSETYRGSGPFSEPETAAIRDLFFQKNFQALISFHSYSQVILYPWGYSRSPAPQEPLLKYIAAEMSKLIQSVHGRYYVPDQAGTLLYLTNGDTVDWAYGVFGIPAYTIELPPVDQVQGGFFNSEDDIQSIFQENLPAMLYLTDWAIQNYSSQGGRREKQESPEIYFPKGVDKARITG